MTHEPSLWTGDGENHTVQFKHQFTSFFSWLSLLKVNFLNIMILKSFT
jgi:hypothetical protein